MKIKTSELSGNALDWAVSECEGKGEYYLKWWNVGGDKKFTNCLIMSAYSTSYSEAGPIIEKIKGLSFKHWLESKSSTSCEAHIHNYEGDWIQFGPTQLIAIMRCYVASKLGEEVEIPDSIISNLT